MRPELPIFSPLPTVVVSKKHSGIPSMATPASPLHKAATAYGENSLIIKLDSLPGSLPPTGKGSRAIPSSMAIDALQQTNQNANLRPAVGP